MKDDLTKKKILDLIEKNCKDAGVYLLGNCNVPEDLNADRQEIFDLCDSILRDGLAKGTHCSAGYYFFSLTEEGRKYLENS